MKFLKAKEYNYFRIETINKKGELLNDIIYKGSVELRPDMVIHKIVESFLVEQRYAAQLLSMMREEGSRYFDLNCVVRTK